MHRVIQVGHRLISAVNGQGVLDQVIGADGKKIKILQEHLERQRSSGNLDHGAHLHRTISHAPVVEFSPGMVDQRQSLADLAGMHQHRDQHIGRAMGGRTQDGAQLGQKHGRLSQAPADGAQTQRRIQMGLVPERAVQRLVGAHIHGADGDRQALHAFYGTTIGLVLLVLVGQTALAAHEQKFAAKQTDTHCARLDCARGVFGHFNIGQQLDFLAVQGHRRGMQQAQQPAALELALALLEAVFGQDDR